MSPKWRSSRSLVFEKAALFKLDGSRICDGVLCDLSKTGARVRLSIEQPIVSNLTITCVSIGLRAECEIVWRRRRDVGLRILRYERPPVTSTCQPSG